MKNDLLNNLINDHHQKAKKLTLEADSYKINKIKELWDTNMTIISIASKTKLPITLVIQILNNPK